MSFNRPRRWSQRSRVERVDLYTRVSLYVVLWGFCGSALLAAVPAGSGGARTGTVVVGGVVMTALGSLMLTWTLRAYPRLSPLPWLRLTLLLVAGGAYFGAVGLTSTGTDRGTVALIVVANLTAGVGGFPDRRVTGAVLAASGALFGVSGGALINVVAGVAIGAVVVYSVRASLWLNGIVVELDAARGTQTQLALAEERLRFSRDVHDVLGRQLSTIAVSSELAATLAARGDDRAAARMLEVRGLAHTALTEARELARGYRATSLHQEMDGARSLLRSAGVDVQLEVDVVPRAWHEAAAWVVRESVTNILRHSTASTVRITLRENELCVSNDGLRGDGSGGGAGADGQDGGGAGLRGLHERLTPLGATLTAGSSEDRWTVVVRLPGTGPISATTIGEQRNVDPGAVEPGRTRTA